MNPLAAIGRALASVARRRAAPAPAGASAPPLPPPAAPVAPVAPPAPPRPAPALGVPPRPVAAEVAGARVLRRGMSGPDVAALQAAIGVSADGIFGPTTWAALVAWQQERGLVADGVAGPATWREIGVASSAPPVFVVEPIAGDELALARRVSAALAADRVPDPEGWANALAGPMLRAGIVSQTRAAQFLANASHETEGLTRLVEVLYYTTPAAMMRAWPKRFVTASMCQPFLRQPQALAERVYGGRMGNGPEGTGDGWRFIGRGIPHITGRSNYTAEAARQAIAIDQLVEALETRRGAAEAGCSWWVRNGLNELADTGDTERVRWRVNGGANGLDDVDRRLRRMLPALR